MQQIMLRPQVLAVIALSNHTISANRIGAGTATSTFTLANTGVASGAVSPGGFGGGSYAPEWLSAGTASNYDARWTTTSGTLSTGTAGAWLNLGTSRSWTKSTSVMGLVTVIGTVEIRDAATLIVLDTATIQLDAEVA